MKKIKNSKDIPFPLNRILKNHVNINKHDLVSVYKNAEEDARLLLILHVKATSLIEAKKLSKTHEEWKDFCSDIGITQKAAKDTIKEYRDAIRGGYRD